MPGDFMLALHEATSSGGVGDLIATLSGEARPVPPVLTPLAVFEYTASGVSLAADTTYFLVASAPNAPSDANNVYSLAVTTATDEVSDSGWSIGDTLHQKVDDGDFTELAGDFAMMFAVVADIATAMPPAPPRNVRAEPDMTGAEITVEWDGPTGDDTLTGYRVCVHEGASFDATMCANEVATAGMGVGYEDVGAGVAMHTRSGLTVGTEYAVGVRSNGAHGVSEWATQSAGGAKVTTDSGAAIARAIIGIANNAIANRISQARNGGGGSFDFTDSRLAQTARRFHAAQHAGSGVSALLDGSVLALSSASTGGAGLSFWASGDYLDIGGGEGASDWDGDVVSLQLGADARTTGGKIIGAAISHSESDIDYTDDGAKGEQKLTLTALHPYIGWRAAAVDADLWASLAYGTGELERKPDDGDATTDDATLIGGAFGAAVSIGHNARLRAEIETARLTLDNAADDGGDLDVDAHRARFGLEWSRTTRTGDATTRRALTGSARYDGGDGITGVGAEIGANIGYDNGNGTAITARLWTLAAHDADYDEWGAGALVQHTSGADGQGFALRIEPSWGATQSRADELLNGDDALPDRAFDSSGRMDGEIAYGIAYSAGMMTPYSGFRFTSDGRAYRIGTRYKLRPIPLEMGLEAYRKQRVDIENGVLLKASVRW